MKKIYLLLFCITTGFLASAQSSSSQLSKKHEFIEEKTKPNFSNQPKGVVLWENQWNQCRQIESVADWWLTGQQAPRRGACWIACSFLFPNFFNKKKICTTGLNFQLLSSSYSNLLKVLWEPIWLNSKNSLV